MSLETMRFFCEEKKTNQLMNDMKHILNIDPPLIQAISGGNSAPGHLPRSLAAILSQHLKTTTAFRSGAAAPTVGDSWLIVQQRPAGEKACPRCWTFFHPRIGDETSYQNSGPLRVSHWKHAQEPSASS